MTSAAAWLVLQVTVLHVQASETETGADVEVINVTRGFITSKGVI